MVWYWVPWPGSPSSVSRKFHTNSSKGRSILQRVPARGRSLRPPRAEYSGTGPHGCSTSRCAPAFLRAVLFEGVADDTRFRHRRAERAPLPLPKGPLPAGFEGDQNHRRRQQGADATGSIAAPLARREEPQRGYAALATNAGRDRIDLNTTDATRSSRADLDDRPQYADIDIVAVGGSVVFLRPNPLASLTNGPDALSPRRGQT